VVLQQTTRELWAQQGPFEPYTIHGITQQNVPEIYLKCHRSAWTPLSADQERKAQRLEETRTEART
jgi:hypothetical protein